jgi:hypothetical protein
MLCFFHFIGLFLQSVLEHKKMQSGFQGSSVGPIVFDSDISAVIIT